MVGSDRGFMSGETSYFSRFLLKFVEILGAGLASAISAYAIAHFGELLLSPSGSVPASTVVQVGTKVREAPDNLPAQPAPPLAAAAVSEQAPALRQDTDTSTAQPAPKVAKDAKTLPPPKHTKMDTSVSEKERGGQKSAEDLARAALANFDANRPASTDAPIGDVHSAPVQIEPPQASVPPHPAGAGPRPRSIPPSAAPDIRQSVQPRPATGANALPRPPDIRTTVNPSPPDTSPTLGNGSLQPSRPGGQDNGVLSALTRIPDLLRPDPPPADGETPRPPMPIVTATPEQR
jgi:hypothetical protein